MKFKIQNLGIIASMVGLLFFSACASGAEDYVALNSAIAKKCGVTFNHPKSWKMFYVEPNSPENHCIIAYKNLKTKHNPPTVALADGWREISDGGFVFNNTPVTEQFEEFDFKIEGNGEANYLDHSSPRFSTLKGYKPVTVDGFYVTKQGGGTLYIGHAHYFETNNIGGKIVTTQTNRGDFIFGNKSISIGKSLVESNEIYSTHGEIEIHEKIYRSMRFIEKTN